MTDVLSERERSILDLLAEEGTLSVSRLVQSLGVSAVTIRADLQNLEERGFLERTRGGAAPSFHSSILERLRDRTAEKTRIAKAAAGLVRDGDRIMLEAGTTAALVVRHLAGKRDIHIVTNSALVLAWARGNPALSVTITGGEYRRLTESMVGPLALDAIARHNVRLAFVGTDGFSLERGMTARLVEGAEIVKAMVAKAETSVLLADSTKYGKAGFVSVLPLSGVSRVIMDDGLPQAALEELRAASIDITLV
ncbi:MAG TPA: DeoR/GlpR family DNA-binding transcription regulator [Rectinemataceae bacterium]|nr:DeoR/GlpR family DNA-binding transcription regulator [Rectinemataceae bacterium]